MMPESVRQYMAEMGRKGGKIGGVSKSTAKGAAARLNGMKGGRPKKIEKTNIK